MTIQQEIRKAALDELIDLYEIDATTLGGTIYRFTPMTNDGGTGSVLWQAFTYTALPITATGFEWSTTGAPPKPQLSVSNVSRFLQGACATLDDLVGAQLTRTRTFRKYLDGQPDADPTMHLPIDRYIVEQKTSHNQSMITWKLASHLDQEGFKLPRRQVLRDKGFPGAGLIKIR